MSGLQSEQNPLRTRKQFYQPIYKTKIRAVRKNFPQIHNRNQSYSTIQQPLCKNKSRKTLQYLDGLEKAKHIHRSFHKQELYYPDPQNKMKQNLDNYKTISCRNKSLGSRVRQMQFKTIGEQRSLLLTTFQSKSDNKQTMNNSFYNTKNKGKFYMNKFEDCDHLTQRSSPVFQNMLNRTMIEQYIVKGMKDSEHKFIHGY